jgi:hypothetical protein
VHETALVAQHAVAADQDIIGHRLSKHFNLEHVGNDFFRFLHAHKHTIDKRTHTVDIGVDESDVIIARNNISKGRQALFDALNGHLFRKRISQMLQFLDTESDLFK